MSDRLEVFKNRIAQHSRLAQVSALLEWDQQTQMPPGAANSRAEQSSTLSTLMHELSTSQEMRSLLEGAEADVDGQDSDSDEVRMVVNARRDFDRATKLPTDLVAEIARHTTLAQEIWMRARQASDFEMFAPALEKMIDLTRRQAECLGYKDHIYDALIELYEPGTTTADVAAIFADLKPHLVKLVKAISQSEVRVDDSILFGDFPVEQQRELSLDVVKALGYDMNRGRQDVAAHPFCTNFSRDDVRITTRFDPKFFSQALYASIHEAGHAMYEQGSPEHYEATTLAGGTSLGVHESQSRLWENIVGRSRAFCYHLFPLAQQKFPTALGKVDPESFYRAVNKVTPSLIRVEADEVTYNLHILLRFELECELLEGKLSVKDLPAAWNDRVEAYLGIRPPDDANGVLQDVHWSCGLVGYFPTYSIGNLLSAQLWDSAKKSLPGLEKQIGSGEFAPLLAWLRQSVHSYGSKFLPKEIVLKSTGKALSSKDYVAYLVSKYSDIYAL